MTPRSLLSCAAITFPLITCAQSITPYTFNNGGGSASSIEWSIGESVSIANFTTPNYLLNTGLLQPLTNVVTSINEYGPVVFGHQITISPNPTTDLVHLKGQFNQMGRLSFQVIDSKSSVLLHILLILRNWLYGMLCLHFLGCAELYSR